MNNPAIFASEIFKIRKNPIKPNRKFRLCGLIHNIRKNSFDFSDFSGFIQIKFLQKELDLKKILLKSGSFFIVVKILDNGEIIFLDLIKSDIYEEMVFWSESKKNIDYYI